VVTAHDFCFSLGRDILVLVDVKFSHVKTKGQNLGAAEVNTKMAHCAHALANISGRHTPVDYHKVYVIFLAMRDDVTENLLGCPLFMDGKTPVPARGHRGSYRPFDKRIVGIVLNRDMLKTLIGDTLFYRAMFSLDPKS